MADDNQTDTAAENTAASTATVETPPPVDANGDPIPTSTPAPIGIPPVFLVQAYPAANIFTTLVDADVELKKQAAANPGTEYAIFESRRTGLAPAPTVAEEDVATV